MKEYKVIDEHHTLRCYLERDINQAAKEDFRVIAVTSDSEGLTLIFMEREAAPGKR